MFETLKRLYQEKRLTEQGLRKAVDKGWISQERMEALTNGY